MNFILAPGQKIILDIMEGFLKFTLVVRLKFMIGALLNALSNLKGLVIYVPRLFSFAMQ